jgi:hypothetical protein
VASDPDNDPLTYSATGLPSGLSINATTGIISGTVGFNASATNNVIVTVNDGHGGTVSTAAFAWTITLVNRLPTVTAMSATTLEDTAKTVLLSGTDPDGDTLTFSIVTQPAHGTLTGTPPNVTYAPALNYNGADSFTYKANDGTADSNVATVSINVTAVNDAPVLTSIGNKSGSTNVPLTFTVAATDPDGDSLTYTTSALPSGATFNATTRTFSWTPSSTQAGSYSLTFTATDNGSPSLFASETITITIANVINAAPVTGPITWNAAVDSGIKTNTAVIASASFTDTNTTDRHTATINWGDGTTSAAGVTETGGNGSVSGTHTYTATGLYTTVLTLTDQAGGVAQSNYKYVVVVNQAGGSEIGTGSFASPLGAYTRNTTLAGSVMITQLNAKYATDGTMNLGTNAFRLSYSSASMSLASTKMTWFVKTTTGKSWLRGEGTLLTGTTSETVNYLLSVVDSTSVADKVRVKIWNKATGAVIYDNQPGSPDDADATQAVSTGPGTVSFLP